MDTIIQGISQYTYIDQLFVKIGFDKELSSLLALIVTFSIISLIIYFGKTFYNRYKISKASQDLAPYYDAHYIRRSIKYFIPTNGQNISPTKEEEPNIGLKFITRNKLIPFFINTVFQGKKESDKFYLILADSGMGKTTFLINLYMTYTSFFNFKSKYFIKLLPFGYDDIIERIKKNAENQDVAKNTILLLDAFDEYKGLLPPKTPDGLTDDERFRKLLDEIFEITRDFRNVIITSRTQYFPDEKKESYELKIPRFDEKGFHKLSKLYLSPFDDKDIKKYLNKKFGILKIWNSKKKRKAKKITGDSNKLMVRPMLLSYIDFLVGETKSYNNTFDIYDTLVRKWIEREGDKRKHDKTSREKFKSDLLEFSKLIAIKMYQIESHSQGIDKETANNICKLHNLNLEEYEITGQSLLTRDVATNWKFAHKSIYEFFVAKKAIEDVTFYFYLDTTSLDMTQKFLNENKNNIFSCHISDCRYVKSNCYNTTGFYMLPNNLTEIDFNIILSDCLKFISNKFSKLDVIEYCNELNKLFGYNIHYDKSGTLRDKNNVIEDRANVTGFIIPTINDVKLFIHSLLPYYNSWYYDNNDNIVSYSLNNNNLHINNSSFDFSSMSIIDIKRGREIGKRKYKTVTEKYIKLDNTNFSIWSEMWSEIWPEWTQEVLLKNIIKIKNFEGWSDPQINTDKIFKHLRLIYVENSKSDIINEVIQTNKINGNQTK